MRPIKLSLSAFGSFSAPEVIEFEMLGENPLFLITGPTGSGKTTILDAICFALYGKTSGDERDASQMRCDAAPEDQLTYVELVFSLQGHSWRIRREPEQLRPKGRGDGLTVHQPRATLYSRDEMGIESVFVASKVTEASAAIEELTGLNVEQFRQVMVLPQGEFRNLLMAKSTDREQVFSHLFQTQIYSRIEFALKDKASSVRQQLEASHNQQSGILQSADVETQAQLVAELEKQSDELKISSEHKERALKKQNKTQHKLIQAKQTAADFDRLQHAKISLQLLAQQAGEINILTVRLKMARAAVRIQPCFDQLQAAMTLGKQSRQNLQVTEQSLKTCQEQFNQADDDFKQHIKQEGENEANQQHKRDLEAYRGRLNQYTDTMAALQSSDKVQKDARKSLDETLSLVDSKQTELDDIKLQQQVLYVSLKGLADNKLELHRLDKLHHDRFELDKAVLKLKEGELAMRELTLQLSRAREQLDLLDSKAVRLELAWHAGQAAVLAQKLEKNQPCPVCGSEDHPAPAESEFDIPTDKARKEASSVVAKAGKELSSLEAQISSQAVLKAHLKDESDAQKTVLGRDYDQDLDLISAEQKKQQKRVQLLQEDEQKEQLCSERIAVITAELKSYQHQLQVAEKNYIKADADAKVAESQLSQAQAELPEQYRLSGRLVAKVSELESKISSYLELKGLATQKVDKANLALSKAMANHESSDKQFGSAQQVELKARDSWQQFLTDSSFVDEASFLQSRLNDEQMAKFEEQIRQHAAEMDQAKGAVISLEQALLGKIMPSLEAIELDAQKASSLRKSADTNFTIIDKRVFQLQDVMQKLDEAKTKAQKLEDSYAVIGTLADTANGRTGGRISLQRFVLSVLLDDVLLYASTRFKRMSKGRYELYRQQGKGKGGGASGLELLVDDAYTGKQRPVATLSGGESFMAALSLALGLSDVVQAYAGGIKLDMLFIDEGFGSLDPESLDLAINTLIDLQSSGRMVGIISHVPELKERINVRLDVVPSHTGSHCQVVLA